MTMTEQTRTASVGTIPAEVAAWVAQVAATAAPDRVVWHGGTLAEEHELARLAVEQGSLIKLNPEWRPNSFLARSSEDDVARVEGATFICSEDEADAGPTNNWRAPAEMRAELDTLLAGSMRGRTMYVVPFTLGVPGGDLARVGVQVTDSPYAVLSMGVMTRVGRAALDAITGGADWVRALHTVGVPLAPGERGAAWPSNPHKVIAHFPESREIVSFGSGYGGNALLAKKCFALRIASVLGRDEGWLAEHMLLIRLISPEGRRFHIAAAFPSACGKTNLAMLRPTLPGWRVETLGDDIAWLEPRADGRLWAINPEAGFFGVAPGTGEATNRSAVDMLWGNTIFTNVALRPDGDVWWEGLTERRPDGLEDWRGRPVPAGADGPVAHPNARFTVNAAQCPTTADDWESGEAVPIDAILFGGRRAGTVPLVAEARDWAHGVFVGATMGSERTAAAEGQLGELRRDPFAMLPFCGYNMADHWGHWLRIGESLSAEGAPAVFQVNWFRRDDDGGFLWPGFAENARVLAWIAGRVAGEADAVATPVGNLPAPGSIDLDGIDVDEADLAALLAVDEAEWRREADSTAEFFSRFGDRLPPRLAGELDGLRARLDAASRRVA